MYRNLVIALAALALLDWPALAQEAQPEQQSDEATEGEGNEQAGETTPVEVRKSKGDKIKGLEQAPGETHTVVKGDTLWDLSARYLQTPWYWPKVWSYNPEIANPHWIYPGQVIRFFPGGEQAPAEVEPQAEEEAPAEAPKEMGDLSVGTMAAPDLMGQDEDTVTVSGKIGYAPVRSGFLRRDGFVTPAELDESGVIAHSPAEKQMLDTLDVVYIKFKSGGAKVGDRYLIYRTVSKVIHPKTGELYGYLTHIMGTLRVAHVEQGEDTGVIDRAYDAIERNDYVAPLTGKFDRPITPKANAREMKGYVLASFIPAITDMGEYHIAFVDKGKRDGVEEGNTFTVVRRSDGLTDIVDRREDPKLPDEDIGLLVVIDVKDKASACLVMRSVKEIEVGDRVEMRLRVTKTAQATR